MPNRNGTGPEGKGPKTGRQLGKCEGAEPTSMNRGPLGRGRGQGTRGRGMGRGSGRRFQSED